MTVDNKLQKKIPLKLGFIGGGLSSSIGPTHYAACQLDGRWQLVSGFFSRNKEINKNISMPNINKWYSLNHIGLISEIE